MAYRLCPFCMQASDSEICPHCGKHVNYAGSPAHLPAGYRFDGKHPYMLGAALGQGGFGITYIALNLESHQRVAIKEYFPTHCSGRTDHQTVSAYPNQDELYHKGRERFLEEAKTLKSLSDLKSIVNVLDFFEANNTAYLVMEYLEGDSLKAHAAKHGKFPAQQFLKQIRPLMEDLEKMHQRGVIHRDIAPDNIIFQPDGQMKLIDFGAARSYLGDKSMTVVVKKGFAPVEQYFSTGPTACSDVYALAATIYYCITGTVPPDSVQRQNDGTPLVSPISLGADITPKQEKALVQALEILKATRTQSIQAFMKQLSPKDAVSKKPIKKKKTDTDETDSRKKRRIILASVAAVLAACLMFSLMLLNPGQKQDSWENNVLMSVVFDSRYKNFPGKESVFGGPVAKEQIISVTFLDSLHDLPDYSWDVSEAQDGSVMAWTIRKPNQISDPVSGDLLTGYDLYFAANGGINGKNCAHLFREFNNVESIHFNNNFHTDQAVSLRAMFYNCASLTSLDMSGFNTSNVQDMDLLFLGAKSLTELDISSFDTSNVTSMHSMFFGVRLKQLDLSHFDTSNVTSMAWMFADTPELEELDISSFDTSKVTDMSWMFYETGLTFLDLFHFDTSNVTDKSNMFSEPGPTVLLKP